MKKYSMATLTIEEVAEMIRNGDDSHNNQVRVGCDGYVYLSQDIIGAENIDDVLFRFESFDAGNDYVGVRAANDAVFIERLYRALVANWPRPKWTYIDDWNMDGAY